VTSSEASDTVDSRLYGLFSSVLALHRRMENVVAVKEC